MTRLIFSSVPQSLLALTLLVGGGVSSAHAARYGSGPSPDRLWQLQEAPPAARADREVSVAAKKAQTFTANMFRLQSVLSGAPFDQATANALGTKVAAAPVEISLPMPRKGKFERFKISEVRIMEPALAARYPDIKTYRGVGIDDPSATVALDMTPAGFHAQIMSPAGWVYISPYYFAGADNVYASYRKQDALPDGASPWLCETPGTRESRALDVVRSIPQTTINGTLRTYRLAVAANSFYVAANGGTVPSTLAAIVTVINRVSAIYESEVAIRFQLIANEEPIIYPTAATDPFVSNGTAVINTSTTVINAAVGVANYDVGHVFTTGSGGVSGLGVVCNVNSKGRSTTGLPTPYGDAYNVDYVAHEIGHEFGGNHTFNGNTGSCAGGNRSATHAYEPGSGNTIMAYAGICGATSDLQPHSDAYFHSENIMEILTFAANPTTGGSCPVSTSNTNSAPMVSAGAAYVIPISTPFTLTGSGLDPDGDAVTYCWEERDLGAAQAGTAADNGAAPIFRSFNPVYTPSRTFPRIPDLLNNTITIGEQLPSLARTLKFRLTARDNKANGGATNSADVALTVSAAAGPFLVTAPNTAITATSGGPLNVTWNVANTNAAPVSTATVNILLSLDGGYTYPVTLAANTANDGSETVTLPAGVRTGLARVRVEATNSIYFDISNANFTIN